MSGTITTADGPRRDAGAPQPERRTGRFNPVTAVIVIATFLALALRVYYQYTRSGFLLGVNEYDDGPYFGSAVRLVHGVLPYRSFIFVQPPGITLLMSPVGLLTRVIGTAWGLAIGRVLTVLASTAGVVLAGLLVRHRGLLAVIVTCGVMAVYPDSVAAAHTVLVEPWLVLFCLIGAVAVFDGDRLAGPRRLAWGGVAFGFAGAVEPWAIVPVIVVFALCLPHVRRAAAFAAGAAAGFLVPVLPFAALAPRQFYQSLIVAQVGHRASSGRVGLWVRIQQMAGLSHLNNPSHATLLAAVLVLVVFVAGALGVASLVTRRLPSALDWFAVLTAVLVVAMLLWPRQFHYHFSAFLAPFLGLAIALPAASVVAGAQPLGGMRGTGRWLGRSAVGLAGVVLVVLAAVQVSSESAGANVIGPIPSAIDRIIPPGSCVLTDQVSLTILANRFVSDVPGCSQMDDGLGTDLALSQGLTPATGAGRVPAVAATWRAAFGHAQYVWLSRENHRRIAWTPALRAYFHNNFVEVFRSGTRDTLYARIGLRTR